MPMTIDIKNLRPSATFPQAVIDEIHRAADEGIYEIRGFGAKRGLPTFDDLVLLGASMSRYPLEGYREKCATDIVLGTRFAKKPLELRIPQEYLVIVVPGGRWTWTSVEFPRDI